MEDVMSIKDLLVVLDADGAQAPAQRFALSLAQQTGAHLTAAGLAVQYVAPVSFGGEYPYDLMAQAVEQARATVAQGFAALCEEAPAGVEPELVTIEAVAGLASARLGALARHFDLTIVGQERDASTGDDAGYIVSTLFGSGRPVFVVPYVHAGPAKLDHAVVAWDGGLVAARALAGAMPLLMRARRVEVVTIAPQDEPVEELPGFNITRHLARHGVNAQLRQLAPTHDVGAALLSHAAQTGADYLVMGAYGHSRLREFVLGGATRDMLASMTLPVLMAH
jgi:nucleotide-binding universal stress UspA family protein